MAAFGRRKESQDDGDDFWSASSVKNSKVNIFDDDITVEAADVLAQSKRFLNTGDDDFEDTDTIEWDGTATTYTKGTTGAGGQSNRVPSATKPGSQQANSGQGHSRSQSVTFGITPNTLSTPVSSSASLTKSQERLPNSSSSSNLSIQEVVSSNAPRQQSANDRAKMAEEIRFLQRSLERAKTAGTTKLPVDDTISCMMAGEPFSLEVYRALKEKLELLDKAIALHDGNTIITVLLFIKKTVKPSLFNLQLQKRPVAVNHYISYLKAHYDFKELIDLLGMLGRNEEAAMLKYKQCIGTSDVGIKVKNIQSCLKAHFEPDTSLAHDTSLLQQHISLLERQRPIEAADAKDAAEGKVMMFKSYPRKASILNMSVITTLYYCCFYHSNLSANSLASPAAVKQDHQLTDKQYVWTALSARSRLKQWNGVDELLTAKGWFGSTKAKAVIGFDRVCEILYQTNAPLDILAKYLRLIDNTERRINIAKRMKCHDVVIDTYSAMKDRVELIEYAKKLAPRSREAYYAQDALNSSTIKWKN